jgi:hypothetical protein
VALEKSSWSIFSTYRYYKCFCYAINNTGLAM